MTKQIHDFYQANTYNGGLTYNSHPLGLATAEAVIEVMEREKVVEHAAEMEGVVKGWYDKLRRSTRALERGGLLGCLGW